MTDTSTTQPRSGLVTGARWALAVLAALFTLGAFFQFFVVGLSFFDTPSLWDDHAAFGHLLGVLTYLMWIPAVLGRAGARLITATILLLVLFGAQYAFIESGSTAVNALHPLNGSFLLVLGFWITMRSIDLLRRPVAAETAPHGDTGLPDKLERSTP